MAGYRDLPMGRHDVETLSSPGHAAAFARFVELEEELLEMLRADMDRDKVILREFQSGSTTT
ncbi:MAG: hypothetical protein ACRD2J_11045 [Thermoanaerobaculia bacterium]